MTALKGALDNCLKVLRMTGLKLPVYRSHALRGEQVIGL